MLFLNNVKLQLFLPEYTISQFLVIITFNINCACMFSIYNKKHMILYWYYLSFAHSGKGIKKL